MRSGKIIFNEVHQFENYNNIKVFVTGQGKVAQPRVGIFTSNGEINDGPLDDYLARGRRILFENEPDNGFLPFICCLETKEQVHDPENWYMANPSLFYLPDICSIFFSVTIPSPHQISDSLFFRFINTILIRFIRLSI